jgi:hypothetical protein
MTRAPHFRISYLLSALLLAFGLVANSAIVRADEEKKKTKSEQALYMLEWEDCEKSYYELMRQKQQIGSLIDDKKKSPCKTGKRIKVKNACPSDKKFSELPSNLKSMTDAIMTQAPDDYPFAADLNMSKVFQSLIEHANSMIKAKCEKLQEFDN